MAQLLQMKKGFLLPTCYPFKFMSNQLENSICWYQIVWRMRDTANVGLHNKKGNKNRAKSSGPHSQ